MLNDTTFSVYEFNGNLHKMSIYSFILNDERPINILLGSKSASFLNARNRKR